MLHGGRLEARTIRDVEPGEALCVGAVVTGWQIGSGWTGDSYPNATGNQPLPAPIGAEGKWPLRRLTWCATAPLRPSHSRHLAARSRRVSISS